MSGSNKIAKVSILPIREAFPKEAAHFTKWLETNIEALSERVGIDLTVLQREKSVGDFNVDLLCEDADQHRVIVENQLEKTDHDHLGKLLTYMVNLDAKSAIWVTSEPRQEHEKVIDWLNEATPADISFYLVKVEGIKVGDSPMAPFFTVLGRPDNQTKVVGEKKKEWAERHYLRHEFWTSLLERSKSLTALFSNRTPSKDPWLGTGAGKSGLSYVYVIWMDGAAVELYIDVDKDAEKNKRIFDQFFAQKNQIEQEMGQPLDWDRLDNKRGSRIRANIDGGCLSEVATWPIIQSKMIEAMIKLEKTFKSKIGQLR